MIARWPKALLRALVSREINVFQGLAKMPRLAQFVAATSYVVQPDLDAVKNVVIFVGHPRSGHSLLGALLDAHPQMTVAHELNLAAFIQEGIDRDTVCRLLAENALAYSRISRQWGRYCYGVEGLSQGRSEPLRVIGDKKGAGTTKLLGNDPELYGELRRVFERPVKIVNVVRHPLDLIARTTLSGGKSPESRTNSVFRLFDLVDSIQAQVGNDDFLQIYHEELISDPKPTLQHVCSYLGVESPDSYTEGCARVIFGAPSRTRDKIDWPSGLREQVEKRAQQYDYLRHYDYRN